MIILKSLLKESFVQDFILITIGVSLMAVGIRFIYEPLNLVTGGVSGFAIVIRWLTGAIFEKGIPVWVTTALVNVPLFLTGIAVKGKEYIKKSLYGTILYTLELSLIPQINIADKDYFLAAVLGGVIGGAGLGLVMRTSTSTGGTDLLACIIRHFYPQYSISTLIFIVDSSVVVLGAVVFGVRNAAYAIVAVYVTSRVIDAVLVGTDMTKMVMIVTKKRDIIANSIIEKLKRGVTGVNVKGMYSNTESDMLICAVTKREVVEIIKIVYASDNNAFIMISDIRQILGEGFKEISNFLQ